MKSTQTLVVFTTISVLAFTSALPAGTITSTFDADSEGWMVADLIQPLSGVPSVASVLTPSFTSGGGNPGGAIQQGDPSGNAWFFSAPSKFLGDKSAYLSGTLSWDLALDRESCCGTNKYEQVILHDGTNALYYLDSGPSPANTWRGYTLSLVGASFHIGSHVGPVATDTDFQAVLSNLQALYVLGDWVDGFEVGSLDNVRMTQPACPPASIRVSEVEVCWPSVASLVYQVDYRSDLTTNTWVPLFTNIIAVGRETCVTDRVVRGTPQRFYRVVCPTEGE